MTQTFVDMPDRIAHLPRDHRGFPVPRFVEWIDGVPDFRVMSLAHLIDCVKHNRCWLCGGHLGRHKAFVIGPMCAINKVNSEPPCHYECARFAARNCPFLIRPKMRRNEVDLPEGHVEAAGVPLKRNPGCCAIWVTGSYKAFKAGHGNHGYLFSLGPPARIEFWAEGRPATRDEVIESIRGGLPSLQEVAEHDGPEGIAALQAQVQKFERVLDQIFPKEKAA